MNTVKKMDLTVKTFELPKIESNFKEIKTQLETVLEKYKDLIFTEETMKEGKDTRAELNKFKKLFEDKRKEIKKKFLSPYEEFEIKVKELVALIDKPIEAIDLQIKSYEKDEKEKKRINVDEIYENLIGDLKDTIPFDKIFDDKWLNKSKSIKSINDEISEIIEKAKKDLQAINELKSEFNIELNNCYSNTFDLIKVLALKNQLEERRKIEELKKEAPKEVEKPIAEEPKEEPKKEVVSNEVEEELFSFSIKLTTTTTKKNILKKFLLDNSITFEVIK